METTATRILNALIADDDVYVTDFIVTRIPPFLNALETIAMRGLPDRPSIATIEVRFKNKFFVESSVSLAIMSDDELTEITKIKNKAFKIA